MDTVEEQPGSSLKTKQTGNIYGKFLIMLAGLFTLRIVLDLATYFTFPRARYDELQRAEYPGQLLVNEMQERGIISFNDVSSLINALEELNLDGVKNDVLSLFKIHTSKNTVLLDKLKILQGGLKAVYKTFYNAIQPIPYIRDKLYCVDDVFVDSGIQLVKVSGKKTPSRNAKGDTTKTEDIHMKSYRDIFDSKVLSSKRIIVEGEPGYGKSTLTIKAAYDWCKAKSPSPLAGFEVFILLKFSLLRGITSIYKAIKLFALPRDCKLTKEDVEEILTNCARVVIVLDGFDEYPDMTSDIDSDMMKIIKGTMFTEQNIVLCTRSGCLPRNIGPGTVHVRLTGFDDVARDQYIRLALGGVTNEFVNELQQDLDKSPVMSDLCQVPLFFVMFSHMASDSKDILRCDSVTTFFKYMINCFYNHMWKKNMDVTAHDMFPVETADKSAVCKLAFEGLTDENQTLVWERKEFFDKAGKECCEELIKIGILVEEELLNDLTDSSGLDHVPYRHVIRFYHTVFTEWYAAHHLSELAKEISFFRNWRLGKILKRMNPQDVQFVFRFACGLNPITFTSIFKYLGGFNEDVATLCIFEAASKVDEIKSIVKKMCLKQTTFSHHHSRLLQRSRIQLLNIASNNQISISHVYLDKCYSTVYLSGGYHLQLKSNLYIPVLTKLNKLTIYEPSREITVEEFTAILQYSSKCLELKELEFLNCLLPQSVQAESVSILRSRNVNVFCWSNNTKYQLNLQSCLWEEQEKTVDNLQAELVHAKKHYEEQEKTLREVLKTTAPAIEELTGERTGFNDELNHWKHCLDISQLEVTTLTEDLANARAESTSEIEKLSEQLKLTKQQLDTGRTESTKEIKSLTEQLKKNNQSLDLGRTESTRKIASLTDEIARINTESTTNIQTLTEELEQTQTKSAKQMERLIEELKQTKQSKAEYVRQIEKTTEELTLMRRESSKKVEILTDELAQIKHSFEFARTESNNEIETLTAELNETKQQLVTRTKELETANKDFEVTKHVLKETKQDRDITRTELRQYQLDFAKESKALKEVLNQTKEAMTELQKRNVEDKPIVDSEETGDEGVLIRAAEYGRLVVAIAEELTLDHCLKLAILFDIPASDCDTVVRVSLIASPGIKFLDVLKKRKVINMFDVTNLQKGLAMLHLEAVNKKLVEPYRVGIRKEQYELYKAKEMLTWRDVDACRNSVKEGTSRLRVRESQTSREDDTEHGNTSQTEATAQQSQTRKKDRRSILKDTHHQLYTEHSIGREGGIIQLANVSLTVPPDALHESRVIAVSVMNESPFPLDREVDTARMTPIIKLEPLGLMFKKSLQLNIPHSALITDPENHGVIIYSGKISRNIEDSSDLVTWTEEGSIPRQLKEKCVTVGFQCLSYLSASLVSKTTAPPLYIVRAVPFLDGVRNHDDDITLTISFCSNNDFEYNMLLSDYKTKLPLEQYSTLQLRRRSERDEDDAGFLSVTVTSVNNTYVPDAEQAVKKFAVSHLCTASRVSHQLRLKKNQTTDKDAVDIMLTFSQFQYEPTEISLKARIKDLIISEKSERHLAGSLPPGNTIYEDMVVNSSSRLGTEQCRKLATHFQLTSEDTEMITSYHKPGKMLMKTLESRSVMDSQKMILFFEGLKACHLDEIAQLVSEYTSEISKQIQEKEQKPEEDIKLDETEEGTPVSQHMQKKSLRTADSSLSNKSVQPILSSSCVFSDAHVKTLTKEGYTEHEVEKALDISRNRLVLARKVLQCIREQRGDVLRTKDDIFLHKEQYIDENGGEITLREANVHLLIPVGAISKGSIVSLTMMTSKQGNVPSEGRTPQLSPVIILGQESAALNKPVTVRIPHCASETEGITSTDIHLGFSRNGKDIQWKKRKDHEPKPTLKEHHFDVLVQKCCAISMNIDVDFRKPLSKKLRVLPLISRIVNSTDELTVTLWIYNDDETEHMHLLHEEINVRGKLQVHDFKTFTLKSSEREKEVHIKSGNNKITSNANISSKTILSTTLWHNPRHSVEFHFQNREGIGDISFRLRVCPRQLVRIVVDLQIDLKVTVYELLHKPREPFRALEAQESQPAMEKSFQELVSKLTGDLDVDACLEIAGIFRLSSELRDRVKKTSEPGKIIFDELIHEQLATAANVSALDEALTRIGKVQLAEYVKAYRHRNATFPTTIFTLL